MTKSKRIIFALLATFFVTCMIGSAAVAQPLTTPPLTLSLEDYAATVGLTYVSEITPVNGGAAAVDMSYSMLAGNDFQVPADLILSSLTAVPSVGGAQTDFSICPWIEVGPSTVGLNPTPDNPGEGNTVYLLDSSGNVNPYTPGQTPSYTTNFFTADLLKTGATGTNIVVANQNVIFHVLVQPVVGTATAGESLTVGGNVVASGNL